MKTLAIAFYLRRHSLSANWSDGDASARRRRPQTPTAGPKPPVYVSDFQIDVCLQQVRRAEARMIRKSWRTTLLS